MPSKLEFISGPMLGEVDYCRESTFFVASDRHDHISIASEASPNSGDARLKITILPDGCWVENLSQASAALNNSLLPQNERARLRSGDVLSLGQSSSSFTFSIVSQVPDYASQHLANRLSIDGAPPQADWQVSSDLKIKSLLITVGLLVFFSAWSMLRLSTETDSVAKQISSPAESPTQDDGTESDSDSLDHRNQLANQRSAQNPEDSPDQTVRTKDFSPKLYEKSIVWLRADVEGFKFPWCSGWILNAHQIVVTANSASALNRAASSGGELRYYEPSSQKFVEVQEIAFHPVFANKDVEPEQPLSPNLAILHTAKTLPASLTPSLAKKLPSRIIGMKIHALGFEFPESEGGEEKDVSPKSYNRFDAPRLVHRQGTVRETLTGIHRGDQAPHLIVELKPWPGCDGAAVFNETGTLIGTLFKHGSSQDPYVVLNDHLLDFANLD